MAPTNSVFVAHFEDEDADQINSLFYPLWTECGLGRSEFIREVFKAGLLAVKIKNAPANKDTESRRKTLKRVMQIKGTDEHDKMIELIYEKSSPEEFTAYCQDAQIDADAFKVRYSAKIPDQGTWSLKTLALLDEVLKDGDYHKQEDIRSVAEVRGLVKDDKDWNNVRVVASRNNLTSDRRGFWKRQ